MDSFNRQSLHSKSWSEMGTVQCLAQSRHTVTRPGPRGPIFACVDPFWLVSTQFGLCPPILACAHPRQAGPQVHRGTPGLDDAPCARPQRGHMSRHSKRVRLRRQGHDFKWRHIINKETMMSKLRGRELGAGAQSGPCPADIAQSGPRHRRHNRGWLVSSTRGPKLGTRGHNPEWPRHSKTMPRVAPSLGDTTQSGPSTRRHDPEWLLRSKTTQGP